LRPGRGGIWWVGREDAVTAIRDVKGLHYLRIMLQRPGADIPAIDLSDTVAAHPGAGAVGGDVGEVLDKQALSAYRRRLAKIDADLGEARSWRTPAGPRNWRPNAMRCWTRYVRRPV